MDITGDYDANMTREAQAIMDRARHLIREATRLGFDRTKPAGEQPLGAYDLWASADKALCNAHLGIMADSRAYVRDAENALHAIQRRGRGTA